MWALESPGLLIRTSDEVGGGGLKPSGMGYSDGARDIVSRRTAH